MTASTVGAALAVAVKTASDSTFDKFQGAALCLGALAFFVGAILAINKARRIKSLVTAAIGVVVLVLTILLPYWRPSHTQLASTTVPAGAATTESTGVGVHEDKPIPLTKRQPTNPPPSIPPQARKHISQKPKAEPKKASHMPVPVQPPPESAMGSKEPSIYQHSEGANSPNIVGDGNQVSINPVAPSRRLSKEQRDVLFGSLSSVPKPAKLELRFFDGPNEMQIFGEDFRQLFNDLGWNIHWYKDIGLSRGSGLYVVVANKDVHPKAADILVNVLSGMKFELHAFSDPKLVRADDEFLFVVAPKE